MGEQVVYVKRRYYQSDRVAYELEPGPRHRFFRPDEFSRPDEFTRPDEFSRPDETGMLLRTFESTFDTPST